MDRNNVTIGRSKDGLSTSAAPAGGSSAMDEDDIQELGDEEKEKLIDLDYLTRNPLPSDILLYAVPACAPYNALQTYKYRVKITPGTAKKGKGTVLFVVLEHNGMSNSLSFLFLFELSSILMFKHVGSSCQNCHELVPAHP
jgi:hypothetical protein